MLNHVVLMGRLTADPELHMIDAETQKCVCNVVIACERKKKEQVDFIRCVAWNNRAKFLWEWFRKGSMKECFGQDHMKKTESDVLRWKCWRKISILQEKNQSST